MPGIALARQLSSVVLPAWVPPATRTLRPARTLASRNRAAAGVSVPRSTRSCSRLARSVNLRMLTAVKPREMPSRTTCRRCPSGSIASTNGWLMSMRRPLDLSIRSTSSCTCAARQHRGGQLVPPLPRDEHLARVVDPHLLDRRVVEVGLQRTEAGHPGHQLADHRLRVRHRRDLTGQAALVVGGDHPLRDPAYGGHLGLRVDPVAADGLAHPRVEVVEQRGVSVGVRESHPVPVPSEVLPHPDPGNPDLSRPLVRSCGQRVTAVTADTHRGSGAPQELTLRRAKVGTSARKNSHFGGSGLAVDRVGHVGDEHVARARG